MNEFIINAYIIISLLFAMIVSVVSLCQWHSDARGWTKMKPEHQLYTAFLPFMFYLGPIILIIRGHY